MGYRNKIYKTNVQNIKKGSIFLRRKLTENYEEFHGGKYTNAILIRSNLQATKNLKITYLKKIYIRNNFPEQFQIASECF